MVKSTYLRRLYGQDTFPADTLKCGLLAVITTEGFYKDFVIWGADRRVIIVHAPGKELSVGHTIHSGLRLQCKLLRAGESVTLTQESCKCND